MQKKSASSVIKDSIEMLPVYFNEKNKNSEYEFNLIMGRIVGFVECGLLTQKQMDFFIDYALKKYDEIELTKS